VSFARFKENFFVKSCCAFARSIPFLKFYRTFSSFRRNGILAILTTRAFTYRYVIIFLFWTTCRFVNFADAPVEIGAKHRIGLSWDVFAGSRLQNVMYSLFIMPFYFFALIPIKRICENFIFRYISVFYWQRRYVQQSERDNWDEKLKHSRLYIIWTEIFFSRIRQRERSTRNFDRQFRALAFSSSAVACIIARIPRAIQCVYICMCIYGVYGLFDESESLFAWTRTFPGVSSGESLGFIRKYLIFNILNKSLF